MRYHEVEESLKKGDFAKLFNSQKYGQILAVWILNDSKVESGYPELSIVVRCESDAAKIEVTVLVKPTDNIHRDILMLRAKFIKLTLPLCIDLIEQSVEHGKEHDQTKGDISNSPTLPEGVTIQ